VDERITMLAKRPSSADSDSRRARPRTTLPLPLLGPARRRLGFLAALFAGLLAVDLVFALDVAASLPEVLIAGAISVLLSALLAGLAFGKRVPTPLVLDLGLVFEVVLCFLISTSMTRYYWRMYGIIPLMDWVTPLIILFPLLVPTPPRKALLASLAAAATPTLGVALLGWRGEIGLDPVPLFRSPMHPLLVVTWSPLVAVFIAYLASRWVYGLGRDVARAQELGSYRLVSRLGQGGMGEVWRAHHRLLARPAAIKLIRPERLRGVGAGSAESAMRRFEREAQATASMRCPHTIQVYDFGISAEGDFFYVMELLDGIGCDRLVERFGPLPAARAVHLLRQVCASLAEAHEAGLIHRDVKPANVFACRYGREVDFVKVLDFGLVKTPEETEGATRLTAEHAAGGTPATMAPEQILGNRPVDARTDLYAVGCLGYWLLTGDFPFRGETAMEVLLHHAHTPASAPSGAAELEVPAELDRLILACLEKDPDRRPASAEELARDLAACIDGSPWTREEAVRWWETHHPAVEAPSPD
jgi:serine/threonine-protein kinase